MNGRLKRFTARASRRLAVRSGRVLRSFKTADDGVLAAPFIFLLMTMLVINGLGMDLVRHERDRAWLQNTLDRAVLAATDLDQPRPPAEVVLDYLSKAGLEEYYQDPVVEALPEGAVRPSSKKVTADVNMGFNNLWLNFTGSDQELPLTAHSVAIESIGKVEISLVLDVSGSMGNNNRLPNLKLAAKEFVETMEKNTEDGNLSISIVPYSTQVAMPQDFLDEFDVEIGNGLPGGYASAAAEAKARSDARGWDYTNCVNFQASDFNTTALSSDQKYQRTMPFSVWTTTDFRPDDSRNVDRPTCTIHGDAPARTALLFEDNVTKMQDYIEAFTPGENTSLDLGMKWGVALLDPSIQPQVSAVSQPHADVIAPRFKDRPVPYQETETMKVVVLMTDGQNTSQYVLKNDYRVGESGIWFDHDADVYSSHDEDNDRYYWHNVDIWSDHPHGQQNSSTFICTSYYYGGGCYAGYTYNEVKSNDLENLTYEDLFAETSLRYMFSELADEWMSRNAAKQKWWHKARASHGTSTKDARTRAICEAAKDKGIVVFTIGFEAPSDGQAVLEDCASSDAHYYDVEGLEIKDAFANIASTIRQLRLTE